MTLCDNNEFRANYSPKQRRRIEHDSSHVEDPKRKFPDEFNHDLYYRGLRRYIGNDCVGAPDVDFFHGVIDVEE